MKKIKNGIDRQYLTGQVVPKVGIKVKETGPKNGKKPIIMRKSQSR